MKKFLFFLFVTAFFKDCYAATGNANDGFLFAISVMVILLLMLATGYFIDFLKYRIKHALAKRRLKRDMKDHESKIVNSCIESVPGLNGLSGIW